jgi:threonine dehydrogenase-like Zn-dependent dehydrogenase
LKNLHLKFEKVAQMLQKVSSDPSFKLKIYDLIDRDDLPEVNLINEDWVKIKVKLGGICGTDLHLLVLDISTALTSFVSYPAVLGHELVGSIVELGKNVDNFSIGERVAIEPIIACEVRDLELCDSCKAGNINLCSNLDEGAISPGAYMGLCKDIGGGWGEFVVAHKSQLFKIPESVSYEEAVITEPLATALHGIFKKLPEENENCVVIGCGTIGLATITLLKVFSKANVIAIAKYPFQSELAKTFGADDVYLIKRDMHIKKIGRKFGAKIISPMMEDVILLGGGIDLVIDTVGNTSSLSNAIRLIKYKGTIILVGLPAMMAIDWTPLIAKETTIIPSMGYSYDIINGKKQRTFQAALDLITSGQITVKDFLTHKFSIDQYKEALEITANKKEHDVIKTAFTFE